jgi:hypothetical protein
MRVMMLKALNCIICLDDKRTAVAADPAPTPTAREPGARS